MPLRHMFYIPSSRALCAVTALLCFAAAVVLTPSNVRSQPAARDVLQAPTPVAPESPLRSVAPQRDAFEPRASIDDEPARDVTLLPSPPPRPMLLGRPAGRDVRVTAIATGERPTAIVDDGGTAHAISTGDSIAGARVDTIDADSIHLSDGRRIPLTSGQ